MIFFAPHTVESDDCTAYFEALDGETVLASCRLLISGSTADVFELSLNGADAEIGEGLLRASYNYAANKGAYWGVCSAKGAEQVTARLRFETVNGRPENDIPTLLSGSCCPAEK